MSASFIQDFTVVLLVAGLSGAVCRRLGASTTIGYLLAGMVVGPYTPPVDLVSDIASVHTLSQLGLIFLMFSTGMSLSFGKLSQSGIRLFFAVFWSAIAITVILRIGGGLYHSMTLAALFVAGMIISSSSAIISRILNEGGLIHRHSGQLAMTFTLLEDLAAIILFSIVGAYATAERVLFMRETGAFFAFLVLASTMALLFVPRFLDLIQRRLQQELQTLIVAGLLCLMAVLATKAGYSPALGAFLLGLIIAGTRQRAGIERAFEGLRDVFSAVFFVSIGMLIDVRAILNPQLLILLPVMAIGAIVIRFISVSSGLLLNGYKGRIVIPTALTLTVTGEFSFIFAQLGIERGVLPEYSQALAVGVCILTAAFASFAAPRGERLAAFWAVRQPAFLAGAAANWQNWIETFRRGGQAGVFWGFARKRVLQIVIEMLLVTGMLIFTQPLQEGFLSIFRRDALHGIGAIMGFWIVFGLFILLPLIAIWRNVGALALFCAEAANQRPSKPDYRSTLVENVVKLAAAVLLAAWLWLLWPIHVVPLWVPLSLAAVLAIMGIVFWRKMILWHSVLEGRVHHAFHGGESVRIKAWRKMTSEWNLHMEQHVMADTSPYVGRSIAELGLRKKFHCTIVAIERQDFLIMNPPASAVVYPQDELLLMGTADHLERAREWLSSGNPAPVGEDVHVEDIHFETIAVPENSPRLGKTLAELRIPVLTGVQIAGIRRDGIEHLAPHGTEVILAGDELLALGFSRQLTDFVGWLAGERGK